ncbi:putative membrane protein YeiB [Frondihabitans sp. PhB188]|uniref:heparan-alpha-glucosaminide N-acetyltransferase domain-containing protein n=1 Tax=Frondihabitans sp. PhB188 TaxID=2485200 RepID=UPI000F4A2702|nr:heparan-alpha-glucosaminide N-acetyltransferase domain-containing protein [Frondihabitans sp. PhB188]ROQ39409.1 putative membrane protein YeiB [Frondihabitans sp. PhB188]
MTLTASRPAASGPGARLRGIDAARGIALFGMFAAHLVDVENPVDWSEPSTWWSIVAGRSSVLFAVLAGVSLALTTGRDRPVRGAALTVARRRIATRGVLIAVIGILLMLLETPVAVILATYGILFVVLLPALSWSRVALLTVAGGLALVAFPISLASVFPLAETGVILQQIFLYYPLATFAAYLLLGLAVGRSDLRSPRVLGALLGGGTALAVVVYSVGEAVTPGGLLFHSFGGLRLRDYVFASEPHSSTLVDMLGSAGVALAVIGACGLLARVPRNAPLFVLARVGAMPLSIYSAHLVVIAWLYHSGFLDGLTPASEGTVWALFVVGACLAALAWGGRPGPLERAVAAVARAVGGRAPEAVAPGVQGGAPVLGAGSSSVSGVAAGESTSTSPRDDWAPPSGRPL